MDNYLYEEVEISHKRYKANKNDILKIFNNLSENWSFDGLEFITQIIEENNKYVMFGQIQNGNSNLNYEENDNVKYLEINPLNEFSELSQFTEEDNNKIIYPQLNGLPIKAPSKSICFGFISIREVSRLSKNEIDVVLFCCWPLVLSFWQELNKILHKEFKVVSDFTRRKKPVKSTTIASDKTQARASQFQKIKGEHPDWGYEKVAEKYNLDEKQDVTGETVRNAYRSMGWKWKKSTSVN